MPRAFPCRDGRGRIQGEVLPPGRGTGDPASARTAIQNPRRGDSHGVRASVLRADGSQRYPAFFEKLPSTILSLHRQNYCLCRNRFYRHHSEPGKHRPAARCGGQGVSLRTSPSDHGPLRPPPPPGMRRPPCRALGVTVPLGFLCDGLWTVSAPMWTSDPAF